ncbi:LysR substrate-binding domain-containing protein, partial [Burkholderia sp. SIMBA_019]|uniref:LysR substrate-binding domain-containing protein n=1 Tax=Burkholderia sp. SIMBA_019 TaxID=3085765 RepID=UPI00397995EB
VGAVSLKKMMVGLLGNVIARYHRSHPGVKLDLFELNTDETIEHVRHGRADFGIVSTDIDGDELAARVIYRDTMHAAYAPG